jgi:hypothetical protein
LDMRTMEDKLADIEGLKYSFSKVCKLWRTDAKPWKQSDNWLPTKSCLHTSNSTISCRVCAENSKWECLHWHLSSVQIKDPNMTIVLVIKEGGV